MARPDLDQLARRARSRWVLTAAALVVGATLPPVLAGALLQPVIAPILGLLGAASALAVAMDRARRLDARWAADRLDRRFPQLEDSSALLLREAPSGSDSLAARQFRRVEDRLVALGRGQSPNRLLGLRLPRWLRLAPLAGFALAVGLATLWSALPPSVTVTVRVVPPAYTGLAAFSTTAADFAVPEGSIVSWTIDGLRDDMTLTWSRDGLDHAIEITSGVAELELELGADVVYRFAWSGAFGADATPTGAVSVVRDEPPQLLLTEPVTWPIIFDEAPADGMTVALEARDEYALASAVLLLTVAAGEGEAVKFRERRVDLALAAPAGDEPWLLGATLLPEDLEMGPGDELYVQFEVTDNRPDNPGRSLSPTVIFRWLAPTLSGSALDGLPVDRVPDYFRSQRQIIIDTERLVAERRIARHSSLAMQAFKTRAQALAMDQRSLRLRYGQYLGEEAESERVVLSDRQVEGESGGSEGLTLIAVPDDGHGHGAPMDGGIEETEEAGFGDEQGILDEFGHSHDYAENATLFDPGTKGTLKQALDAMWQAELGLGLHDPEAALPYEYEALRNLKAVQQAARIYVKRVGFEPPPLSEERRLSGEREEVTSLDLERPLDASVDPTAALLGDLLEGAPDPERLTALGADAEWPAAERALARRLLEDSGCEGCRRELTERLLERSSIPPLAPAARLHEGSMGAGRRYLERLEEASDAP
ncbi:MAG: DUF4175 family protein [Pseudomonadota bacterium]